MHVGLAIKNFVGPTETPDVDALIAYAERAEALGFESLWAWDHVILGVEPSFPILDSVGILTAIAARTRTIKLGTGVMVLPLRNPTVAAKALSTLDVISRGRLILGGPPAGTRASSTRWACRSGSAAGSSSATSTSSPASGRTSASVSGSTSSICARP
jgi:alkanesulfonate monooxygenase SsuD/methylene tetrahydromethanopterin reductase-like flavin-dependent oxidoreductase (luciferase family)